MFQYCPELTCSSNCMGPYFFLDDLLTLILHKIRSHLVMNLLLSERLCTLGHLCRQSMLLHSAFSPVEKTNNVLMLIISIWKVDFHKSDK